MIIIIVVASISAAESKSLRILLSFAVGGLLGDVFLNLLPQAWSSDLSRATNGDYSVENRSKISRCPMSLLTIFLSIIACM